MFEIELPANVQHNRGLSKFAFYVFFLNDDVVLFQGMFSIYLMQYHLVVSEKFDSI